MGNLRGQNQSFNAVIFGFSRVQVFYLAVVAVFSLGCVEKRQSVSFVLFYNSTSSRKLTKYGDNY
jgi:hypothetical protein